MKGRPTNRAVRPREYLTPPEVARVIAAASGGALGHRDATMILLAYRHGFRASEVCRLQWASIDLDARTIQVNRIKGSASTVHPLGPDECKALVRLAKDRLDGIPYLFHTRRSSHMSRGAFLVLVKRAGAKAGLPFPVHPHMLRHACGYKLANDGRDTRLIQSYLGHRNIQHTVRYTELSPERFRDLWK